jgi:electron transport complex protein RnfB
MAAPAKPVAKTGAKPRKKLPKELAVIRADNCTGCEACIEVCPVDCIYKVPGEELPSVQSFCDIDLERCIGCSLCERWCPWDAIDMVPTPTIARASGERSKALAGGSRLNRFDHIRIDPPAQLR